MRICFRLFVFQLLFQSALWASPATQESAASQPASSAPAIDLSVVLARTTAGDFTLADLKPVIESTFPLGTPESQVRQILMQPKEVLQVLAEQSLAQREIVRYYRETSPTMFEQWRDTFIYDEGMDVQRKIRSNIEAKILEVTDEKAREYYEKNKIKYHTPLSFHMRHLSLTAMVEYTSKPGDTLESIAKAISGSEDRVSGILTNSTGKIRRWVPPDERHRRPMVPLSPGESLLVPMSPEDRQAVRILIEEKIMPQIKAGVSLEELAKKYSEAADKGMEIGPLPFGTTPFLPELLAVAKTLPIGQVSDIIETPHGFEIIQITQRTDEYQKPFEEVKEQIQKDLAAEQLKNEVATQTMMLWGGLTINYDVIAKPDTPDDAVAVTTKGGFEWTRADIERLLGDTLGNQRSEATILSAVQGNPVITAQLYIEHGRETGLYEKDKAFAQRIELRKENFLSKKLVEMAVERRKESIGESEVRAWYQEHIKEFTPPRVYDVRQIVIRLDPDADLNDPAQRQKAEDEAIEKLRTAMRRVDSQADFIAAVRKVSEDPASREKQGSIGQVVEGYRSGKFAEVLAGLSPQTASEPFIQGNMAYVIWIDKLEEFPAPKFEEKKDVAQQRMLAMVGKEAEEDVVKQALQRINFEIVP